MTKYLGKDYRHFNFSGSMPIDLYDLRIGDYFMEDTYPEVYQVTRVEHRDGIGMSPVVLAHDITDDIKDVEFFYSRDGGKAYSPVIVKLEPKE